MSPSPRLTRRHVIIYEEDYELIQALWGQEHGLSFAVRQILHDYLKKFRADALEGVPKAVPSNPTPVVNMIDLAQSE